MNEAGAGKGTGSYDRHIYISGVCARPLKRVYLQDKYGKVIFVLLPFVKPAVVGTNGEAVERLLGEKKLEEGRKVRKVFCFPLGEMKGFYR